MAIALIALGSNLGDRAEHLRRAVDMLGSHPGIDTLACSAWHETQPIGGPAGQQAFLNGAALLETTLSAHALLDALQAMERSVGRVRRQRWGPRPLDLDVLLYDQACFQDERLSLPHPRMSFRRFVLEPASEIAPHFQHEPSGRTVAQLLDALNRLPHYVAITGPNPGDRAELAAMLHRQLGCPLLRDPSADGRSSSPGDDRHGRAPPQAIEWGTDRADVLRKEVWQRNGELARRLAPESLPSHPRCAPVVSDFWWHEWRAMTPRTEDEVSDRRGESHAAMDRDLVPPKLLVWLTMGASPEPAEPPRAGGRRPEMFPHLVPNATWEEVIRLHGPGPLLRICRRQTAGDEVAAAVAAMAPP